jgi:hypothetical protein
MRIVLITFTDGNKIPYSSLKPFYRDYPQFEALKNKIDYQLSRRKEPFICSDFTAERMEVRS